MSPRRIAGYFQFHFIDVVPANWPKSIVSHDLRPKKAYFEMAQVNQPIAVLPRLLDLDKPSDQAGRRSLFTHVTGDKRPPGPNSGRIWIVVHGKAWLWIIPFADGQALYDASPAREKSAVASTNPAAAALASGAPSMCSM